MGVISDLIVGYGKYTYFLVWIIFIVAITTYDIPEPYFTMFLLYAIIPKTLIVGWVCKMLKL